jgi:hypothetical protein
MPTKIDALPVIPLPSIDVKTASREELVQHIEKITRLYKDLEIQVQSGKKGVVLDASTIAKNSSLTLAPKEVSTTSSEAELTSLINNPSQV